jgi:hypothetical protein
MTTGELKQYRPGFLQCVDCCTDYLQVEEGLANVNGHEVYLCPWCRADSAPWMHGRGI